MNRRVVIAVLAALLWAASLPGAAAAEGVQAYQYLVAGDCAITVVSGGVALWGRTVASQNVDRISVVIYLQRWTGKDWVTIDYRTFTALQTWYVSGDWGAAAVPGYYYRALCEHVVTEGSTTEYGYSSTQPVRR